MNITCLSFLVAILFLSSVQLFETRDCSLADSPVQEISQEKYWSRLPFPSPGDLPNPGSEPVSPLGRQIP